MVQIYGFDVWVGLIFKFLNQTACVRTRQLRLVNPHFRIIYFLSHFLAYTHSSIKTKQTNKKISTYKKEFSFQLPCCTCVPLHSSVSLDYLQYCFTDDESSEGEEGKSADEMPQILININDLNHLHPNFSTYISRVSRLFPFSSAFLKSHRLSWQNTGLG